MANISATGRLVWFRRVEFAIAGKFNMLDPWING